VSEFVRHPVLQGPESSEAAATRVTVPATFDQGLEAQTEQRWTRWVDKGLEHDRAIERRWMMFAAVVVLGFAAWLSLAL